MSSPNKFDCARCGRCGRSEAGESCQYCNYPYDDNRMQQAEDGNSRLPFRRFIEDRARSCPIAHMICQVWNMNPTLTEEQFMMLALTNYAAKADHASRLLEEWSKANVLPLRVV